MPEKQVIAIAGVGELGRYICEELASDNRLTVVVLTRQNSHRIQIPNATIQIRQTDYTLPSILSILTTTGSTALISTLRCPDPEYIPLHTNMLKACQQSPKCKRFIPSEWGGNIDDFPDLPRAYGGTRGVFRGILKNAGGVDISKSAGKGNEGEKKEGDTIKYTLIQHGWCMEYLLPVGKSYRKVPEGEFPIDIEKWKYEVRGTGDEMQSFTMGRDVAGAVKRLLLWEGDWEPVTYVAGQWASFNEVARIMEEVYGQKFQRTHWSLEDIQQSVEKFKDLPESTEQAIAEAAEWTVMGATAVPKMKTLSQREMFFADVKFRSIRDMLKLAGEVQIV